MKRAAKDTAARAFFSICISLGDFSFTGVIDWDNFGSIFVGDASFSKHNH